MNGNEKETFIHISNDLFKQTSHRINLHQQLQHEFR